MVVNRKGIVMLYTLMLGITIIVLGLGLAGAVKFFVDDARTNANCSTATSDWDIAFCWLLDLEKPAVIGGIIFVGLAVLAARQMILK